MSKLYIYMPKTGGYGCKLYSIQDDEKGGHFHGILLYSKETDEGPLPGIKYFPHARSEDELAGMAERWIRANLFEDYEKSLAQMMDEIPHGVM